jgi:hypothetical protein
MCSMPQATHALMNSWPEISPWPDPGHDHQSAAKLCPRRWGFMCSEGSINSMQLLVAYDVVCGIHQFIARRIRCGVQLAAHAASHADRAIESLHLTLGHLTMAQANPM